MGIARQFHCGVEVVKAVGIARQFHYGVEVVKAVGIARQFHCSGEGCGYCPTVPLWWWRLWVLPDSSTVEL